MALMPNYLETHQLFVGDDEEPVATFSVSDPRYWVVMPLLWEGDQA